MDATPLHHKPIIYGSPLANTAFFVLVILHILPAAIAPISGIVALASTKGMRRHIRAGRIFMWSMAATAVTGTVLDVIRLSFHVAENHTKYAGYSMPSTYPARLGFLYAGLALLYVLRESIPPRVWRKPDITQGFRALALPGSLLALGLGITLLVVLRYNPWTGALWMVWTFALVVAIAARGRLNPEYNRIAGVSQHRFGMTILAAFSWWAALQGFGPAIGIALKGADMSTTPYVGNQPGPFTPFMFAFLVPWALCFLIGVFLIRKFRRKRAAVGGSLAS